jgi:cytochrome b subunit of formate dehydrogenase
MWILIVTMIVGGILIWIFGDCEKISKRSQAALSYAVWAITIVVYVFVLLNHSDFMTATIKDYQEGHIIKYETISIEGADTVKIVKYKYK